MIHMNGLGTTKCSLNVGLHYIHNNMSVALLCKVKKEYLLSCKVNCFQKIKVCCIKANFKITTGISFDALQHLAEIVFLTCNKGSKLCMLSFKYDVRIILAV